MRTIAKLAIAAVTAGGLGLSAAAPADAASVHVGIGLGVPAYPAYYGPYYGPNPCNSPYADPYYCGYPAYWTPGVVSFGFGHDGFRGHEFHGGFERGFHGEHRR
jgi:hypothetical protein